MEEVEIFSVSITSLDSNVKILQSTASVNITDNSSKNLT